MNRKMYIGLDAVKTAPKSVVHKAGEFLGNKVPDEVTKSCNDNIEKQEPVEEIIVPPENWGETIKKLRKIF